MRRRTDVPRAAAHKLAWSGVLTAVQPRIRLIRSFDQRAHDYAGYVLRVHGRIGEEAREFLVAIGEGAQRKHGFRVGDGVSGRGVPVDNPRKEIAELYKVSALKPTARASDTDPPPPWRGVPPPLDVYRDRGHRRLATRTFASKCASCIWACRMPVEMIIDQWNPQRRRYRTETFCYGPLSCPFYSAGPTRKVPGRHGMQYEEEDWVDEDATAHRLPDD